MTAFHAEARKRGVVFQRGSEFTFDGRRIQNVRLGYGALTEHEMSTAVERLREAALAAAR